MLQLCTSHQSQHFDTRLDFGKSKWLGQDICRHLVCGTVNDFKGVVVNHITQPEVLDIKMLHPAMMLWVLGNIDGRHVVNVDGGGDRSKV